MRVLLLSYDLRRRGGIERLSGQVAVALQQLGHDVVILDTRRLGPGAMGRWLGRLWFLLQVLWQARFTDRLFSLHAMLLHRVEPLLPRHLPRLVWLHGVEVWGSALPPLVHCLRRCFCLVASSGFTRDRVVAEHPGSWPQVRVIHPMADLWRPQDSLIPLPLGLRMLTVARMDPLERYKGHDLLLEALVPFRNHDWSWLVVGEGGDRLRLEELVRHWGLESRVRFSGLLSDADLREAYSNCSLLAMPSAYELLPDGRATGEGFGIAYLEAACMGRPSLACTLGGQTDLIVEGQTGWLVEPTVSALQRVLQQILDNPQELASRGAAARFRAVNDFGAARFNKQIAVLMERSS